MIKYLKYFVLGSGSGLVLLLVGFSKMSWEYWLILAWIFVHSIIWSYFDTKELMIRSKGD